MILQLKWNFSSAIVLFIIWGIILGLSSNSWVLVWLGLEVNAYAFISILSKGEFRFKYFLIQSLGSLLFIYRFLWRNDWYYLTSLIIKLRSAPFFLWIYPSVKWLKTNHVIFFFSLQKIIPFFLILNYKLSFSNIVFLLFFVIVNVITGVIGVWRKKDLKDIIIFSSIYQFGWIVRFMFISLFLYISFIMIYFIMVVFILFLSIPSAFFSHTKSNVRFAFLLLFLIGGLPPSIIFIIKIVLLDFWISSSMLLFMTINSIVLVALFYNYIKIIFFFIQRKQIINYSFLFRLSFLLAIYSRRFIIVV